VVQEAFLNLTTVLMPDFAADPTGKTQKVVVVKKGNGYMVPIMLAITYITIPFDTLKSKEVESAFIADSLNAVIEAMKAKLIDNTFYEVLSDLQESYAKSIYRENISYNMQTFVKKKGITRITKAHKISKYFTRTTTQEVTDCLWATSTDTPKYEPDLQFQDSKANESTFSTARKVYAPMIFQYLNYVDFYTFHIFYIFYDIDIVTPSNPSIRTSLAPVIPVILAGIVRTFADLGEITLQL
jgi:hypothetical protein